MLTFHMRRGVSQPFHHIPGETGVTGLQPEQCASAHAKRRGSNWIRASVFPGRNPLLGVSLIEVLLDVIAPVEALHTASGVKNALRSREERMAFRGDVNLHLRLRAVNLEAVAARAGDGRLDIVWMDTGLHATPAASRGLCPWACWSDTQHVRRFAHFISIPHLDGAPLG